MADPWEHCDVCGLSENRHSGWEHAVHENAQNVRPTANPEENTVTDQLNLPNDPRTLCLLFSEWLDGQHLVLSHEQSRDDRSHEALADEFLRDLSSRRNEGALS